MKARSLTPIRLLAILFLASCLTGCSVDMPAADRTAAPAAADPNAQAIGDFLGQIATAISNGNGADAAGIDTIIDGAAANADLADPETNDEAASGTSEDDPDLAAAAAAETDGETAAPQAEDGEDDDADAQALAEAGLVNLRTVIPGARFDIRYATANNFTGQAVYENDAAYLKTKAAAALKKVQAELAAKGMNLKIWDAYRPLSAQRRFWEIKPDPTYVARPEKGSRHNKGFAVDVTLTDASGTDLEMPSAFDDFSSRAATNSTNCSATAQRNRAILHQVMKKHGFADISSEWWHFDFPGWEGQPNLDIQI